MQRVGARERQQLGYLVGFCLGIFLLGIMLMPGTEKLHMRGPIMPGHENLTCESCHVAAPGTTRQQLQANVRYFLGMQTRPASVGHDPVSNTACLECHERPNDRHPVFRFWEPRFAEARAAIHPENCTSCHLEHKGQRVTIEPTYCLHCHTDLALENDPIDVPHVDLIAADNWTSCLGCHDFHGNHLMETPTMLASAHDLASILAYFEDGASPYPADLYYPAQESNHE